MAGTATPPITYSTAARIVQPMDWNAAWAKEKSVATKTANYTATVSDRLIIIDATSNTVTITLPAASGNTGLRFYLKCINAANTVTIDGNASETIDGETTQVLLVDDCMEIICDGTNWRIV